MVLMAGYELPMRAIRQQVASALDLIVHLERMTDGSRKVTAITEVQHMEGDVITTQDLFVYRFRDVTDGHSLLGGLQPTGLRPTFLAKLERHGIQLPSFMQPSAGAAANGVLARTKVGSR